MVAEALDTLASLLHIPQFNVTVIAGTDKIGTIVIEADVFQCLTMAYSCYGKQHIESYDKQLVLSVFICRLTPLKQYEQANHKVLLIATNRR